MSWDPYAALGVSKSASAVDIRKAYRKLAKELHPDVRPNDDAAAERFKRITAAFNLLSDETQRGRFDRGEIDADGNEQPVFHGGRGFEGFGGFSGARSKGGGAGPGAGSGRVDSFEDLFDGLFSRGGGARGFGAQRGEDVRYRMDVDFLDAVNGGRRRVTMSDGRSLDLAIPAGLKSGQTLRLKGQGMPGANGGPAGDAMVEVTVGNHPVFRREGDDIRMELRISLAEAVEGGKVTVTTPSGPVTLTVPPGTNSGEVLKLRGKGVQTKPTPGDLLVRMIIVLPKKDDPELQEFVRKWSLRKQEITR
ncbi:MAG: DnaJ C-terminal domain-containing protein [Hyphomonadaceae bacterium]